MNEPDLAVFIETAKAKQRVFRQRRLRWCRKIGLPVRGYESEPVPGVLDVVDDSEG